MDYEEITPKSYPTNLLDKDWSKRKCAHHRGRQRFFDELNDLEVYDDDVWLVTLPKCGTTWMQELLWLVMNDFDYETAKSIDLERRSPYMEFIAFLSPEEENLLGAVKDAESPRVIKSHLPLPLLPPQLWKKKPKTIYVYRNPKDAWISFYHHFRQAGLAEDKTLEQFLDEFITKRTPHERPFEHVTEFYALRHEPWVYYTSFEQMKRNLRGVVEDICKFLNKPITEEQMVPLLKHLSFEEMKNNPTTSHRWEFEQMCKRFNAPFANPTFVREGNVGAHKKDLSAEFNAKLDAFIEQQLASTGCTMNQLLLLDSVN